MSFSALSSPLRVLVVEDHEDLAANIGDFLSAKGHRVDFAFDGRRALELLSASDFDVILLDILLPEMNGLGICQRLREDAGLDTPVLMLSALDAIGDKVAGFRAGTDDYMTKPFSLEELECRLEALARRAHGRSGQKMAIGGLELDAGRRTVAREGRAISLTQASFTVLTELMRASPNVVTRQKLETVLWGDDPPDSDALRSQIYILRRAIDRPFSRPMLETVHGVGYRIVP